VILVPALGRNKKAPPIDSPAGIKAAPERHYRLIATVPVFVEHGESDPQKSQTQNKSQTKTRGSPLAEADDPPVL